MGDLPAGFVAVPAGTSFEERSDGVAVYEVLFARERTAANLAAGPVEVRNGVARTGSIEEAAAQFTGSREAFVGAAWTESPVPPLGEASVGLSRQVDDGGERVATHLYLYRKGTAVVLVGVGGRADVTRLADTVGYAIVVSDRLDAARLGTLPGEPARPSTSATAPSAAEGRVRVANVDGGSANVRAEPSTAGRVLAQVPEGTVLELAGPDRQSDGRVWRNVRLPDGRVGWVAGDLLTPVASSATPAAAPSGRPPTPSAAPSPAPPPVRSPASGHRSGRRG